MLLSTADPSSESKEDQWMGVTVQSQGPGGKVVVSVEKRVHSMMSEHRAYRSEHNSIFFRTFKFKELPKKPLLNILNPRWS